MANIEEIKAERPLLEIGKRIPEFARMGWEEIPEDDRDVRLKWYGVFHRKQTPGHFMMRIRIPNGIAGAEQVRTLAGIANEFGRGAIDITTRQQVQLRWIRIENVPEIIDRLGSAGLLTLQTGMDNIRNLAGCPVAGLTPTELFDASPVVQTFNEMFVGNPEFVNLPRKMNITITGCLDNCTHAETQDIALVPATKQRGSETVAGFNVLVGGKMGSGGYSIAQPLAFVEPADAPRLLATIVLLFRDFGPREARNRSRLAFLIEDWGLDRFKAAVEDSLERSLEPPGEDARTGTTDHIGVFRQRDDRMYYVGLLVPMGRTNGGQLLEI
ncbi:MAG TPA: ferredoxin--nitrite reductase, partial [Dehalococcoidia bacterium]|nr:ferredoxin--nitrite reductase [Dehalococcoidia bacterium]